MSYAEERREYEKQQEAKRKAKKFRTAKLTRDEIVTLLKKAQDVIGALDDQLLCGDSPHNESGWGDLDAQEMYFEIAEAINRIQEKEFF